MIRQIQWADSDFEPNSPFIFGNNERKLKITFHSESFKNATSKDLAAINSLRNFSQIDDIESADTERSNIPYLKIGEFSLKNNIVDVNLKGKDFERISGIQFPQQWLDISKKLTSNPDYNDPEVKKMLYSVLVARAHCEINHDLLITLSPQLLQNISSHFIGEANPCTPHEAIKIVGLYLRYRMKYIIDKSKGGEHYLDKGSFYWVLARHRLPRMWKYFSACVDSDQYRKDGISNLGGSILIRSVRALKARDEIGYQFYSNQDYNTRDSMMYHFDYLTLLLSGIFDSLARVARRTNSIEKPNERNSKFHFDKFLKALEENDAMKLFEKVTQQEFIDLMTMLTEFRNTIHGANLHTLGYKESMREEKSFVTLNKSIAGKVWEASLRYSSPEEWGLFQRDGILFEPYTYSNTLTKECFKFINSIANATDIVRLYPKETIPKLLNSPPTKGSFKKWIRKRVHILG